jgi:hypothetical protein
MPPARRTPFVLMKYFFSIAASIAFAWVIWFAATALPGQRDILHALRMAETVTITEYRAAKAAGAAPEVLTRKTLSDAERKDLLRAFSPHGWHTTPQGSFEPHHRIECAMKDGTTHVIELSFGRGEYALDKGPNTGFGPWSETLRDTLPRLGIPVRPSEFYAGP